MRYLPDRQGYRLVRECSLPPPSLDEEEALAPLRIVRQWKGDAGFDPLRHAREGAVS